VLRNLIMLTPSIVPKYGEWSVDFVGFSSSGWTQEAQALAEEVKRTGESGKNWKATDFFLVDLPQVDGDLNRWSMSISAN
jgi:hypothetical protein